MNETKFSTLVETQITRIDNELYAHRNKNYVAIATLGLSGLVASFYLSRADQLAWSGITFGCSVSGTIAAMLAINKEYKQTQQQLTQAKQFLNTLKDEITTGKLPLTTYQTIKGKSLAAILDNAHELLYGETYFSQAHKQNYATYLFEQYARKPLLNTQP